MEREPFYHRADLLKLRRRRKKDRLTEQGPQTLTSGFIFAFFFFCVNMINMLLVYIRSTISFKHIHIFSQIWISSLTLVCGAVPRQHGRPLTCNLSGHRNWKTRRTLTAQRARRPPLHLPLRSFIAEQQSSSINSHSCQ